MELTDRNLILAEQEDSFSPIPLYGKICILCGYVFFEIVENDYDMCEKCECLLN